MRRTYFAKSASSYSGVELALEDEAIQVAEGEEAASEVTSDLADIDQGLDQASALEDLGEISSEIVETTPTEAALIDTAANMAVAGTDVEASEVVPAMESFVGRRVATESIMETARNLRRSIAEFLRKIFEKIRVFYQKYFSQHARLANNLKALLKKIESHTSSGKDKNNFEITSTSRMMFVGGSAIKDGNKLVRTLEDLKAVFTPVFTTYPTIAKEVGEAIEKHLGEVEQDNFEAKLTSLNSAVAAAVNRFKGTNFTKASTSLAARYSGFEVTASPSLFEDKILVYKDFKDTSANGVSATGLAYARRRSTFQLVDELDKDPALPDSITFTTMDSKQMFESVKACSDMIEELQRYKMGKVQGELDRLKDKVLKAAERTDKILAAAEKDDDVKNISTMRQYFNSFNEYPTMVANMAASPNMEIARMATKAAYLTMSLVNRSLSNYKK